MSETCPQLRLIMERKTGYKDLREMTSYRQLMVDRAAMKVVIGNYTYQGEIHIIPGNLLSKRLLPLITEQRKLTMETD